MKLIICSIRDVHVGFMTPSFFQSEGQAMRMFQDEINRSAEDNILYRHPKDYDLYVLGEFESDQAKFVMEDIPRLLVSGLSAKVPESKARLQGVN